MKIFRHLIPALLALSSAALTAQNSNSYQVGANDIFVDTYRFNEKFGHHSVPNVTTYQDIDGSPYLDPEFRDGIVWMKDTTAVLLPLRYNIYLNEMEYRLNGVNYVIGNPAAVKKLVIGPSAFIYLAIMKKGGYVEVLDSGRCTLLLRRSIRYKPGEGAKPIIGTPTPAEFVRGNDVFFIRVNKSEPIGVSNLKSVTLALADQKEKIGDFIAKERMHRASKENLLKIAKYYNSLPRP